MSIFTAILLGIVQGIAEFLPISSSGHLSILQNIFKLNYSEDGHLLFDVMLHLGTLVAICIYYRRDLKYMIEECISFIKGERNDLVTDGRMTGPVRTVFMIIVATVPLVFAVVISGKVEELYYKAGFVGFALIATGALLYVGDKMVSSGKKNEKTMTALDALIIGLGQAVALIPGLSRSGATITVAESRGLNRDFAVKFSMLMSIPAVLGSLVLTLFKAIIKGVDWSLIPVYLVGAVVSGVVGFFSIKLLHKLVNSGKFGNFAYYCAGLGVITIILSFIVK